MSQPELRLQIAVVHFLRFAMPDGVLWWHTPNGGARDPREAAKLKAMGTTAGVSDLLFYAPGGRLCAIELKAGKGRLSDAQEAWLAQAATNGAAAFVCKTLDEVAAALTAWLAGGGLALKARLSA